MKILKLVLLTLTVICSWGQMDRLHAQFITTSGTNPFTSPYDFEYRTDGTLIAKGAFGTGSLAGGDQGAGTRLLWYPARAAFRAGKVSSTQWDYSGTNLNVGNYSVAMGINTTASGDNSVAMGTTTIASGSASVAMGYVTTASGLDSVAFGKNTTASNAYATAFGDLTTASGNCSTTFGYNTLASASYSIAQGYSSIASGEYGIAMGYQATASGINSVALGYVVQANAVSDLAIGRHNVGGGSATTWVDTDPAFEIGNGTSTVNSNAFTVYKNGNATFQGTVNVAPGGDIPMYGTN